MTENRENELIEKIINIELLNGLNELYVEDIPLWHIIRYRMRGYYFYAMELMIFPLVVEVNLN